MKTVLVYSGGLDSTVLLYDLLAMGDEVIAITFDYGQRHFRETLSARRIAAKKSIEHRVMGLTALRCILAGSSQTSSAIEVPEGHYTEESMKATVVPNRNMIMLSIAAGCAISREFDQVAFAAHSGDHAIYPDCRENFVRQLEQALLLADWRKVFLFAPYLTITKQAIVARGAELGVPFGETWSCYKGGREHCGKCGTCVERREAFALSGVTDPTTYEMSQDAS
jgi:7-cyano-7-deazaguanine synthase